MSWSTYFTKLPEHELEDAVKAYALPKEATYARKEMDNQLRIAKEVLLKALNEMSHHLHAEDGWVYSASMTGHANPEAGATDGYTNSEFVNITLNPSREGKFQDRPEH